MTESSLAIIMTGQTRTFFDNNHFFDMIQQAKKNYTNIFIVCVLNSSDHNRVSEYLNNDCGIEHVVIDYRHYTAVYMSGVDKKYTSPKYNMIRDKYFASETNAKREIDDPNKWTSDHSYIQAHQTQIGLRYLIEYEKEKNIQFDIICKTRFDLRYPTDFYPHIPKHADIFDKITFNKTNRDMFDKECAKLNIKTIDELIEFNKSKTIHPTECRVDWDTINLSFGTMYCYNYYSLENIKNGENNILYALNDMCIFGDRNTFLKMEGWFDESGLIDPSEYRIPHFFAPETSLMIYCFKHGINILCYYNNSFEIVR